MFKFLLITIGSVMVESVVPLPDCDPQVQNRRETGLRKIVDDWFFGTYQVDKVTWKSGMASQYKTTDQWTHSATDTITSDELAAKDSVVTTYGPIEDWDLTLVTSLTYLFQGKQSFNADISRWDISKVKRMDNAFDDAQAFNSDLSNWNTSQVEDMTSTFRGDGDGAFNSDLSKVRSFTLIFFFFFNSVFVTDFSSVFLFFFNCSPSSLLPPLCSHSGT